MNVAMPSDLDIYRLAGRLIEQHGDGAYMQAVRRRDEMRRQGDAEGSYTWRRVISAIVRLLGVDRGGAVH